VPDGRRGGWMVWGIAVGGVAAGGNVSRPRVGPGARCWATIGLLKPADQESCVEVASFVSAVQVMGLKTAAAISLLARGDEHAARGAMSAELVQAEGFCF